MANLIIIFTQKEYLQPYLPFQKIYQLSKAGFYAYTLDERLFNFIDLAFNPWLLYVVEIYFCLPF